MTDPKPNDKPSLFSTNPLATDSGAKRGLLQRITQLSAYQWVLISQLFVVIPHAKNLPIWLTLYALAIILFQLPPLRTWLPARWHQAKYFRTVQYIGFFASLVGLYLTYRGGFSVEAAIAFLLLCAVSKLLELNTRRDAYIALTLALFVLAGLFLINQDLTTTLIVALGAGAVLFAMIGLNDDGSGRFRTLGWLIAQAIPLTVVLFLFFPRLPPLWSVPMSGQNQAKTGISDSMSPGDIANLSQSTELAFRVEFASQVPAREQLYWRGLIFSEFDGVTWRQGSGRWQSWGPQQPTPNWLAPTLTIAKPPTDNDPRRYRVILERTGQPWLFGLDYPITTQRGIRLNQDFTLRYWDDVNQRLTYQVHWINDAPIGLNLTNSERELNLKLPTEGNTRSRVFAEQLFAQAGREPMAYVQAVQRYITTQPFRYTLSPPALGKNRIDEFLFGTRAGFCEHYSSSFTYLMRAAGIPARVVTGYQGGELGRDGHSWEVRQMDAHAWSEIWLAGRGWVRIDPTAFVAPERIEQGMDGLTQQAGASMFGDGTAGALAYQRFQLLQQAQRMFDQASYYWQRDVIGYDQDNQKNALLKWFNIQTVYQQVMVMAAGLVSILTLIAVALWWHRRQVWDKTDLAIMQLSKRLAKYDPWLARDDSEGVLNWLTRVRPHLQHPNNIAQIEQLYRQTRYSQSPDNDSNHARFKRLIADIKPKNK